MIQIDTQERDVSMANGRQRDDGRKGIVVWMAGSMSQSESVAPPCLVDYWAVSLTAFDLHDAVLMPRQLLYSSIL